jgi:hypothetical protein
MVTHKQARTKYLFQKISWIIPDERNESTDVSWKFCALIASVVERICLWVIGGKATGKRAARKAKT